MCGSCAGRASFARNRVAQRPIEHGQRSRRRVARSGSGCASSQGSSPGRQADSTAAQRASPAVVLQPVMPQIVHGQVTGMSTVAANFSCAAGRRRHPAGLEQDVLQLPADFATFRRRHGAGRNRAAARGVLVFGRTMAQPSRPRAELNDVRSLGPVASAADADFGMQRVAGAQKFDGSTSRRPMQLISASASRSRPMRAIIAPIRRHPAHATDAPASRCNSMAKAPRQFNRSYTPSYAAFGIFAWASKLCPHQLCRPRRPMNRQTTAAVSPFSVRPHPSSRTTPPISTSQPRHVDQSWARWWRINLQANIWLIAGGAVLSFQRRNLAARRRCRPVSPRPGSPCSAPSHVACSTPSSRYQQDRAGPIVRHRRRFRHVPMADRGYPRCAGAAQLEHGQDVCPRLARR